MKFTIMAIVLVALFVLGGKFWLDNYKVDTQTKTVASITAATKNTKVIPAEDIVSQNPIHIHPELTIIINGEKQNIPANIGIGKQYAGRPMFDSMMGMSNMHTHDASGKIHWEVMEGPVTKDDVRLSNFFAVWGKDISEFGTTVTMIVNGEENTDLGNYLIKDGDKIVLNYTNNL